MPPADDKPALISFPKDTKPLTEAEKAMLAEESAQLHELIQGTHLALCELRTCVLNVMFDLLEKMSLDTWTLCAVLDVNPSRARELMAKETDELETETILTYLERLRA